MKTIIITGVSGNLGQAVAKNFLRENFKVIGTVIPNDPAKLNISDANFETFTVDLMNEEAKGHNVVTSVIAPSTIDTPQNRKSMPDADPSKWVKAEDIASTIYFYSTEQALAIREPVLKVYNNA